MDFIRIIIIAAFAMSTAIGCGQISQDKTSGEFGSVIPDTAPDDNNTNNDTENDITPAPGTPQTSPSAADIVNLGSCKLCDNAQNCLNNANNIAECSTFYVDNTDGRYSTAQIDELKARMASDCSNGDQVFVADIECKAITSIEPLLDDNNNGDSEKHSCKEEPIPSVQINNFDYDDIFAWHYHTSGNAEFNQDAGDCPIEAD